MADDDLKNLPTLNPSSVASRFVSQKDLERAKAVREEQWKAAYERIGQEPPKLQEDPNWDGRSLAEVLAANKAAKQDEWEQRSKLSAQFRPLDADEIQFLDKVLDERKAEDRKRKLEDDEEVKSFREAVAAKARQTELPPVLASSSSTEASSSSKPATAPPKPKASAVKKDQKALLKGVVVKKKKPAAAEKPKPAEDGPAAKKAKVDP
ncbi:hypothetical protein AURDEDRAFT_181712 [Auricularia subglabra TFB-10046 SS5]|nr:hypothetical protein AURDEDRAFT_181712 [Auricularia subglabra TFB-10046 SS5]